MTQVLQGEGDFSGHCHWGRNAQSPVRAKFRCRAIAQTV